MVARGQHPRGIRGVVSRRTVAIVHLDGAFVSYEPRQALAVISGFVSLQSQVIVLASEGGYAGFARGAILAVEGRDFGADRVRVVGFSIYDVRVDARVGDRSGIALGGDGEADAAVANGVAGCDEEGRGDCLFDDCHG